MFFLDLGGLEKEWEVSVFPSLCLVCLYAVLSCVCVVSSLVSCLSVACLSVTVRHCPCPVCVEHCVLSGAGQHVFPCVTCLSVSSVLVHVSADAGAARFHVCCVLCAVPIPGRVFAVLCLLP